MRRLCLFLFFTVFTLHSQAQIHEVGLLGGGNTTISDLSPNIFSLPNGYQGGLFYRWNINERYALRANAVLYRMFVSNWSENGELSAQVEFNFFDFDTFDQFAHTPYTFIGLGLLGYDRQIIGTPRAEKVFTAAIPFGLGYKWKLRSNWVLGAEIGARYTFTDDLDRHPGSSEFPNNPSTNDWYTSIGVTLSYTFGRGDCACDQ